MVSTTAQRKNWAGSVLLGIAGLHTAFVILLASGAIADEQMRQLAGDRAPLLQMTPGFGSAQPSNLLLLTLFWSMFFGLALAILAVLIIQLERRQLQVPPVVGLLLLTLCLVGGVLAPVSGFWFGVFPAWSILRSPARGSGSTE